MQEQATAGEIEEEGVQRRKKALGVTQHNCTPLNQWYMFVLGSSSLTSITLPSVKRNSMLTCIVSVHD